MAKLKSGTRIYGTATIDTSVVVGSAVTLSSSGIQVTGVVTATTFSGALNGNATTASSTPYWYNPGVGINEIKTGTGDGASYTTYNVAFRSWYGIGFRDYTDSATVNAYLDCRTGNFGTKGKLLAGNVSDTGTASQNFQVSGGAYVSGSVGIGTTNPAATGSTLGVAGTITELYAGQYWNLVSQADVGIGASQVPLNQYLGQLAFVDDFSPTTLIAPRIQSVGEKTSIISGNTASLTYNTGGGNIAICTNPSGDITLAVAGIPTDSTFDNTSLTFSVFVNQTGTARSCTAVTLNGLSASIKWPGGSLSAAISGVTTTSGTDIYSFTGINTIGSASTTANYRVLGVVNGGFR